MKRCGLLRKQFGICSEAVTVHLLQDSVFSQQKLKICPQIFTSVSVIKYPQQSNFREGKVCSRECSPPWWGRCGRKGLVSGAGAVWSHCIHTQDAGQQQKVVTDYGTSRPIRDDSLPPAKPHRKVPQPFQIAEPAGNEVVIQMRPQRTFEDHRRCVMSLSPCEILLSN